jgi:hypothetical protein
MSFIGTMTGLLHPIRKPQTLRLGLFPFHLAHKSHLVGSPSNASLPSNVVVGGLYLGSSIYRSEDFHIPSLVPEKSLPWFRNRGSRIDYCSLASRSVAQIPESCSFGQEQGTHLLLCAACPMCCLLLGYFFPVCLRHTLYSFPRRPSGSTSTGAYRQHLATSRNQNPPFSTPQHLKILD